MSTHSNNYMLIYRCLLTLRMTTRLAVGPYVPSETITALDLNLKETSLEGCFFV